MAEFSTRNAATEAAKDEMIGQFVAVHGRQPTRNEVLECDDAPRSRPDPTNRAGPSLT